MKICAQCKGSFEEGIAYCPSDGSRLTTISKMQLAGQAVPEDAVKHAAEVAEAEGVEDLTGRMLAGRYQISRRLGEGGMGIVYRGVDTRLEKEVAIKVLKEDFAHRSDVVARFTLEAKSAARIKHENVLDVTDYGQTEDGSFYIAMELLVGTDLADVLQKSSTVDATRAVNIMLQVTRALGAAHAKGIVHRDLKPENIFLVQGEDNREIVKIVDFGIAQMKDLSGGSEGGRKLTRTGMIFGTPEYMSPEQAAGKPIDHRVDIYATGVILYETLAGRVPFVGETFMGVLTQHMFENPPPLSEVVKGAPAPPDLEAIINKALAKDPNARYQSMQELGDDLARFRDGQRPSAVGAAIPGAPQRPAIGSGSGDTTRGHAVSPARTIEVGKPRSKRSVALFAGLGALVLVAGGAAIATSRSHGTPPPVTPPSTHEPQQPNTRADQTGGMGNPQPGTTAQPNPAPTNVAAPTVLAADAGVLNPPLPANVTVRVESTPVGARIEVEGSSVSCASTPCELALARGQQVHLVATAPHKHGELALTPDHDGESVSIALNTVAASGGGAAHGGGSSHSGSGGASSHAHGRCTSNGMQVDPSTGLMVPCFLSNH